VNTGGKLDAYLVEVWTFGKFQVLIEEPGITGARRLTLTVGHPRDESGGLNTSLGKGRSLGRGTSTPYCGWSEPLPF